MSKSSLACEFSLEKVADGSSVVRLWTFTLVECVPVDVGARLWGQACKALVREVGFSGVRVFELHPGGHGLHVHFVTSGWYRVDQVRPIAQRFDFGRVNVKEIPAACSGYVAKYLRKSARCGALKGRRLWACVNMVGSKCKDISISTPFSRFLAGVTHAQLTDAYGTRYQALLPERGKGPDPECERRIRYMKFRYAWSQFFGCDKSTREAVAFDLVMDYGRNEIKHFWEYKRLQAEGVIP